MLEQDNGTLRTVAWSEICPWLGIFRTFRLAISFRVLLLAAVAILLTLIGWAIFGSIFSVGPEASRWMRPHEGCPWLAIEEAVPDSPALPDLRNPMAADRLAPTTRWVLDPFFGAWAYLSRPAWEVFNPELNITGLACSVLCGLWSLAIWAFFGGAITRIAAVKLTCDERIGSAAALRHAFSKWPAYFAAPLFPLLGVLLAALPVWFLGLLLRANVGVLLAALIWPLALVAGLLMAVLLLGLIFGWPLMWATISTEGTDSFDALSRSYAYVFQRPLHYLFYALVAAVLGALGWLLVSNFAAGVVSLSYWAASWGSGTAQVMPGGDELTGIGYAGAVLIRFWAGCVKLLAVGYIYGYFWTASTAIYLLLRHDVDATEMDEVFLDEDKSEQDYGLPPLETDEAGAPVVADQQPDVAPDGTPGGMAEPTEEEGPAQK